MHHANASIFERRTICYFSDPDDFAYVEHLPLFANAHLSSSKESLCELLVQDRDNTVTLALVLVDNSDDAQLFNFARLVLASTPNVLVLLRKHERTVKVLDIEKMIVYPLLGFHKHIRFIENLVEQAVRDVQEAPQARARRLLALETPVFSGVSLDDFAFPLIESDFKAFLQNCGRIEFVRESVGLITFDTLRLSHEELIYASFYMIRTLIDTLQSMTDMSSINISDDRLLWFLLVVRSCYSHSNLYHNFHHAVDVTQVVFLFVMREDIVPPAKTVTQYAHDKLSLLVAALGHDILHPGLTYAPISMVNTVFANQYRCLESYHSIFYAKVLSDLWPEILELSNAKNLIHDVISATEMARHQEYLKSPKEIENVDDARTLCLCQLLKCADIANCLRPFELSKRFTLELFREFRDANITCQILGVDSPIKVPNVDKDGDWAVLQPLQIAFVEKVVKPLFDLIYEVSPGSLNFIAQLKNCLGQWKESS